MPRPPAYDKKMFDSVDEENAYILRQIELFSGIHGKATTEAGWLALKMGITVSLAERKIARARRTQKD